MVLFVLLKQHGNCCSHAISFVMNSVMLEGGDQVNRCMTVLNWYGEDEMRGGGFGCLFRYQDLGK